MHLLAVELWCPCRDRFIAALSIAHLVSACRRAPFATSRNPLRHPVSHKPEEDNGIPLRHPLLHTLLFETATTRLLRHHSNDGHRKAAKKPRRSPPGSMAPQSAEARLWRARVRPASVSGSARPSRSAVAHPCLRLDGAANSLQFSKQKDKKASIKTMHGSAPVRATPSLCRLASFDPRLAGRRALVSMP